MRKDIEEFAQANGVEIALLDGYDDCIIGLGQSSPDEAYKVIYDRSKIIDRLMEDMDRDDAYEYFDFNIAGAYVGPSTPMFTLQI
jgi:hypothetical protein